MEKKSYTVKSEGWLDGTYRMVGDIILMTPAQAEHLEIVGSIEPTPEKGSASEKPVRQIAAPEASTP